MFTMNILNSTSPSGDYLEKLELTLKAISNFLGDRFKIHIKSKSSDQLHSVAHLCWDLWSLTENLRLCIYNVRIAMTIMYYLDPGWRETR